MIDKLSMAISWSDGVSGSGAANDAADALNQLRAATADGAPYALVLLDMQLPGMDGLTLARAIKNDPALANTRVLILAPFGQRLDQELMEESGVSQCVIKPVKHSRLLDALLTSTHTTFTTAPLAATARPDMAEARTKPAAKSLRILLAEDNAVNQKLALRQLRNSVITRTPLATARRCSRNSNAFLTT